MRSDRRNGALPASFGRAVERWSTIDDHDHVLTVRAHGDSPVPWLATEFTDGGTLGDYFDAEFDAALWFAHRIARTVSHAHPLGVIHRGLSPASVRFSTTFGSTWSVPKVGDWGFAGVAADVRHPPVSPVFAAPEHVEPESFGVVVHSTDVYGLGTLLYALFTGHPPFAGEPHVVVGQIISTDPPAPTERNPELPDTANDLLVRALAKRKPERYETVDDLLVALERCIETCDPEWVEQIK